MALQCQCIQVLAVIISGILGQDSLFTKLENCEIKVRQDASRSDELARLRNCQYACQALEETEFISAAGTQCMCPDVDRKLRELEEAQTNENKWMKCNEEINRYCRDQYCQSCHGVLAPSILESTLPIAGFSNPFSSGNYKSDISTQKDQCRDMAMSCKEMVDAGECVKQPVLMQANCSQSCGFCNLQEVMRQWQQAVDCGGKEKSQIALKLLQVEEQRDKEQKQQQRERRIRLRRLTQEKRLEQKYRAQGSFELMRSFKVYETLKLVVCQIRESSKEAETPKGPCSGEFNSNPCYARTLTNSSLFKVCLLPAIAHFRELADVAAALMTTSRPSVSQQASTSSKDPNDSNLASNSQCRQQRRQRERDLQMELNRVRNELDAVLQRERLLLWILGLLFGGVIFLCGALVFRMLTAGKVPSRETDNAVSPRPRLPSAAASESPTKKQANLEDGGRVKQRVHEINASQNYLWNGKVISVNSKVADDSPTRDTREQRS